LENFRGSCELGSKFGARGGGLCERWKGYRLICNSNLNSRGLGAKSVKELDGGLVPEKVRGLIARRIGILITGELFL
jgi:hypothetical protein